MTLPKIAKELVALTVNRLRHPGKHAVGGVSGLLLQVTPSGARSWLLRVAIDGKRREHGLGPFPEVSLAEARERARKAKREIYDGVNPIERNRQARLVISQRLTFEKAAEKYLASKRIEFSNEKHADQWESTLATYATPVIGGMAVSEITVHDIQAVLKPIWESKTETASRLRGRIEAVLSWATVNGHRSGDNPARWKGNLEAVMPKPAKQFAVNHGAIRMKEASAWFAALRQREGISARALEFMAFTAARSGEVRGMTWDEIDSDAQLWVIPAARMKAKREHRVPLTDDAIKLLKALPDLEGSSYVFAAPRGGALSDMSLSAVMRRMHAVELEGGRKGWLDRNSNRPAVPHGIRSTFRDWAAEISDYPQEMAEMALAHSIGNKVEAAYRRGDMMEKRRHMMADWAAFLRGQE
ncbi:integrase arm-type DNA-binding domain-containing protein [Rhizobium sp. TH2]|uniref:tyrosine-type recombinase/integrase n=1 Tax=Rhizobium sp. TH2 TaxID=2775403 RepID=UPI0021576BC1|nr:site-specific integrase [Rhizobium sp. TH2]UVC08664.1 integrase arm-type DNA-binding domain-containing protein [Rhizobium sp. TH2]